MRKSTIILAALVVPAAVAAVGPRLGELRGSLALEADWTSGDISRAAASDIEDLNLLGPVYAGEAGRLELRGASFDEAFDQSAVGARAELSYGITDDIEVFGAVGWTQAGGRGVVIGDVIPTSTGARLPLTATFGEMTSVTLEAGARYYFGSDQFRPFLGASLGAEFVDRINVAFSAPAAGILIEELRFIDATTLFTAGAEAGIAFGDGYNVSGALSVGVRYVSALDGDDTDMQFYGLTSATEGGSRVVFPVKGSLSLRF